jgi:hypothetical protein
MLSSLKTLGCFNHYDIHEYYNGRLPGLLFRRDENCEFIDGGNQQIEYLPGAG